MTEPTFCATHPNVETYLRCNRCEKLICPKCAVRMDVGYRCRACIGRQQNVFHKGFRPVYYAVAAAVALPTSVIAAWLLTSLGCFVVFIGPVAGLAIAELARWAMGRRRGPHTWLVVCGCILIGWLINLVVTLVPLVSSLLLEDTTPIWLPGSIISLVWHFVYVVTATATAYGRLRPGRRV